MTRTEAIAIITAKLAALDDEHVATVAEIVEDMANPTEPMLNLTDAERAAGTLTARRRRTVASQAK